MGKGGTEILVGPSFSSKICIQVISWSPAGVWESPWSRSRSVLSADLIVKQSHEKQEAEVQAGGGAGTNPRIPEDTESPHQAAPNTIWHFCHHLCLVQRGPP